MPTYFFQELTRSYMVLFIYPHVGMLSHSRLNTKCGLKYQVWSSQRLGKASLHQWKQDATLPTNIQSCTYQKAKATHALCIILNLSMHQVTHATLSPKLCSSVYFVHLKKQETKPTHEKKGMCTIRKPMFPPRIMPFLSKLFAHLVCILVCVTRAYCSPPLLESIELFQSQTMSL